MEQKQRLFIYDRREILILLSLGLMVAAFAFTLGVHLGKRVTTQAIPTSLAQVPQTETLQDSIPNKQELTEQARAAQTAADEELHQTLHAEVEKSGIKLAVPRQVDLPSETKEKAAGATTLRSAHRTAKEEIREAEAEHGKFTLQIGSFPSAEEAKSKMDELRAEGLRPYVRSAQVRGLGKRFRLFVGEFSTREDAEKTGRKYQTQRKIESFLVSRSE